MKEQQAMSGLGDEFDRRKRALTGLPDVVSVPQSNVDVQTPVLNLTQTWIVQTYRHKEEGDTIFLQYIAGGGESMRIVIPPAVAERIARQYDTLTGKNRRKGAAQAAETRRANRGKK